jgi:lipopolysaccharide/colanic/teichoic acid biosynthesis glycosyltransferase
VIPTVPILLDQSPGFLRGDGSRGSLLQVPCGSGTLLDEIVSGLASVTSRKPLVMPLFEPTEEYARWIATECPEVGGILRPDTFRDPLSRFDPADALLFVSPATYPADGIDLDALVPARPDEALMARHLLAFEPSPLGTKEFVQSGTDGRVRRIQRYFEPKTWPFTQGVVASFVRVSSLLTVPPVAFSSLEELRRLLSAGGVPSQDVPYRSLVFDLSDEAGVLALQETRVLSMVDMRRDRGNGHGASKPAVLGRRVTVHPTARLLGPVVLSDGAVVQEDALVVGPSLIGSGAVVESGAVVAQCLVMPAAVVPAATTVRHRVVAHRASADVGQPTSNRRHAYVPQAPAEQVPPGSRYLALRAVVEPVLALIAIVLLGPVFLVVAALVKATSKGPIFYGDRREGKDGKEFRCWKFRSMRVDADAMQAALKAQAQQFADGPQFKMVNDPRLTSIGGKLRSLNLDELPQLFNILLGQMSFVGPRPSPFRENQICVPWRQGRLSVRPGMTGLWQVCRRDRESGDFHQWIYYDLMYVRHVSLLVDLRILVATILTLGGRYPVRMQTIIRDRTASVAAPPEAEPERAATPIAAPTLTPVPAQTSARPRRASGGDVRW